MVYLLWKAVHWNWGLQALQAEVCHLDQRDSDQGIGILALMSVHLLPFLGVLLHDVTVEGICLTVHQLIHRAHV